jgi:DNA-binding response OmpR family regulator
MSSGVLKGGMATVRIAFLEDDLPQAEVIKNWLGCADHSIRHFATARSFLQEVRQESYDLLILDWELPESSGLEVLRWLREQTDWHVPILFMTHRDSDNDIVQALSEGADDYITKPVSREVTIARVNALARRSGVGGEASGDFQFGEFRIVTDNNTIMRNGNPIELTEKEFRVALMLFVNTGRLLSRNHMLEVVWGVGPELATRTVDTHISRIRRKLALWPENGWRLKAVYHHGYRLERISRDARVAAL